MTWRYETYFEWRTRRAFHGPKRRFMAQEGRFTEILDVLTTALLADMKRARWSIASPRCARGLRRPRFRLHSVREPRRNREHPVCHRRKKQSAAEESASDANETNHLHLETFLRNCLHGATPMRCDRMKKLKARWTKASASFVGRFF